MRGWRNSRESKLGKSIMTRSLAVLHSRRRFAALGCAGASLAAPCAGVAAGFIASAGVAARAKQSFGPTQSKRGVAVEDVRVVANPAAGLSAEEIDEAARRI